MKGFFVSGTPALAGCKFAGDKLKLAGCKPKVFCPRTISA